MKKQLLFLFIISLFSVRVSSQSNSLLVDFINKNDLLLRSVHKQMYHEVSTRDEALFKKLITTQLVAVHEAASDSQKAAQHAFLVRNESVAFMKKFTKQNLDYYAITPEEKTSLDLKKPVKVDTDVLEKSLLDNVQRLNVADMNVFNSFNTSIR